MAIFTLGECLVDLTIEPLTGAHFEAERQIAWELYLELVTQPVLRAESLSQNEIVKLIAAVRKLLTQWPAAQLDEVNPKHFGAVVLTFIDLVLLPCLNGESLSTSSWRSVRTFCLELAHDLAYHYHFFEVGEPMPLDLELAWEKSR